MIRIELHGPYAYRGDSPAAWCGFVDPHDLWVGIGDLDGRPTWAFSCGWWRIGSIHVRRYR